MTKPNYRYRDDIGKVQADKLNKEARTNLQGHKHMRPPIKKNIGIKQDYLDYLQRKAEFEKRTGKAYHLEQRPGVKSVAKVISSNETKWTKDILEAE